ncbi:hypothetical protein KUTeg_008244 [Tegillarca granosa]|uniref:Uncharacterized protein n=1 Tax=Tegillarca granosa TaxID=220873 RepID=A0ABQ9F8L1_TEGGR|nr:hypothetical protein KUTeg_008244 [Tegillarca granosa]
MGEYSIVWYNTKYAFKVFDIEFSYMYTLGFEKSINFLHCLENHSLKTSAYVSVDHTVTNKEHGERLKYKYCNQNEKKKPKTVLYLLFLSTDHQDLSEQVYYKKPGNWYKDNAFVDCKVDLIIKLGGSIITHKDQLEMVNPDAIDAAGKLVKAVKKGGLNCIICHGAG